MSERDRQHEKKANNKESSTKGDQVKNDESMGEDGPSKTETKVLRAVR